MSDEQRDKLIKAMDGLGEELASVARGLRQLEVNKDEEVAAIVARYAEQIDPLAERRDALVEQIKQVLVSDRDILLPDEGKTLRLRSITLSIRKGAVSVQVADESAALAFLRRKGKLRRFANLVRKYSLNKDALKKNEEFARQIPGIELTQTERLTIDFPEVGGEREATPQPLRTELG